MSVDDADLVLAARSGDRAAWAGIYDRYADRLHDFCWSVLRDRDEAADAMHDAFITAYRKLDQLRDPTRLRAWLFSIARNEALAHARKRGRAVPTEEIEVTATGAAPEDLAEASELRDLVWTAAAGLAARDRAALDLHLRQGLEGAALGEALGTSANNANVLLSRLRDQVERSLGAYLVARRGRNDCAGLDSLLQSWDNEFTPLWRKRIARHVDDCPTCEDRRRSMVSPLALLAGVVAIPAPRQLRERVLNDIDLVSASRPLEEQRRRRTRRRAGVLGGIAAAIVVLLGVLAFQDGGSPPTDTQLATATTTDPGLVPPTVADETTTSTDTAAAPTGTTRRGTTATTTRPLTATTIRQTTTTTSPTPTFPPPQITRASARSSTVMDASCTDQNTVTAVSAGVTGGARPLKWVRVYWVAPGGVSGNRNLNGGPDNWTGTIGPFYGTGTVRWWIAVRDATDVMAQSAQQILTVNPCPQ